MMKAIYLLCNFAAQTHTSSPAVNNGVIYFTERNAPSQGSTAYALNAAMGTLVWKKEFPYGAMATPIYVKGRLYLDFEVLDAASGSVTGSITPPIYDSYTHTPGVIVEDGLTYYPAESGMVQ